MRYAKVCAPNFIRFFFSNQWQKILIVNIQILALKPATNKKKNNKNFDLCSENDSVLLQF